MGLAHVRALIALLLLATPLAAHEIGTTRVDAAFLRDGTYRIDVVTAPRALLSKLEAAAHVPRSPSDLPVAEIRARLAQHDIARFIDIRFGETVSRPKVEWRVDDYAATVRLTGRRGEGAFTWQYRLTFTAYALTLRDGRTELRQWLDGDQRSAPFAAHPPSRLEIARQYLVLGFTHIVPLGLDHILFVLGLFLLTTKLKPLLMQVTAFTIAHSITLGLTIYGVVSLSPKFVEPLIALSIVYVAVENVTTTELKPWRVAIVFAFGLLHGMGFAGVLTELGLPRSEFATALVAFNIGVESGQLAVIGAAFALVAYWHRGKSWYRPWLVVPASAMIAATGIVWTVERVAG